MRPVILSLIALAGLAAAAPAFALNPQPLPPGRTATIRADEPPDPCISFRQPAAHARCLSRHRPGNPPPPRAGTNTTIGSATSGAGAGK